MGSSSCDARHVKLAGPGIEPLSPALRAQNLNQGSPRVTLGCTTYNRQPGCQHTGLVHPHDSVSQPDQNSWLVLTFQTRSLGSRSLPSLGFSPTLLVAPSLCLFLAPPRLEGKGLSSKFSSPSTLIFLLIPSNQ